MRGMVVAPEPLAAEAGAETLARGGNAIDAAIAAGFVQGVVNPLLCGVGGSGLMFIHQAESDRTFCDRTVSGLTRPQTGHFAATPGSPAVCATFSSPCLRHSSLPTRSV